VGLYYYVARASAWAFGKMKDAWFYVISAAVFLLVLFFGKGPRGAKVLAQFLWSAIAAVFLIGAAVIAVYQGAYSKAGKELLLLLLILTLTGFIPGLIIHMCESMQLRRRVPTIPLPVSEGSSDVKREDVVAEDRMGKCDQAEKEVCPRCGQQLQRRVGRYGPFLGCVGFPNCKYTRSLK
jgi:uncharacterized paraquat-inducible protein A